MLVLVFYRPINTQRGRWAISCRSPSLLYYVFRVPTLGSVNLVNPAKCPASVGASIPETSVRRSSIVHPCRSVLTGCSKLWVTCLLRESLCNVCIRLFVRNLRCAFTNKDIKRNRYLLLDSRVRVSSKVLIPKSRQFFQR